MLNVGDKAPDFLGVDEVGRELSLNDFAGKRLVLYFYPRIVLPVVQPRLVRCATEWTNLLRPGIVWLV